MIERSAACVFFFAHPDDEFAVQNTITGLVQKGLDVDCIYLTSGSKNDPRLSKKRCLETVKVLTRLGLARSKISFIGFENAISHDELHENLDMIWQHLCKRVKRESTIISAALEGGHPDHDAVFILAHQFALKFGLQHLSFPMYSASESLFVPFRLMPLLSRTAMIETKLTLMAKINSIYNLFFYKSQWKSFVGLILPYLKFLIFDGIERLYDGSGSDPLIYRVRAPRSLLRHTWLRTDRQRFINNVCSFISKTNKG